MAKFIRLPAVRERYGIPVSTIYDWMAKGLFPRQIRLGKRSVCWSVAELDAWDIARTAARDAALASSNTGCAHADAVQQ